MITSPITAISSAWKDTGKLSEKRICEEGFQPLPVWKNALEKYLQEVLAERKG